MNTLTADEWEDLTAHLATAKKALDAACDVLVPHDLESRNGIKMEASISAAFSHVTNAIYCADEEQKRLRKEAKEVTE